jgi:hypothetical protein
MNAAWRSFFGLGSPEAQVMTPEHQSLCILQLESDKLSREKSRAYFDNYGARAS